MTSGSSNVYSVQFEFSGDWDGMEKTVVFRSGVRSVCVLLGADGQCTIPWEVLARPGRPLFAGVCGVMDGAVMLPTVWANCGTILEGAAPSKDAEERPPTPGLQEQILGALSTRADGIEWDGTELRLLAGNRALASIPLETGVSDHRLLTGRDEEDQHPIRSIEGLKDELGRIPAPVEPLTNEDLEAFLK